MEDVLYTVNYLEVSTEAEKTQKFRNPEGLLKKQYTTLVYRYSFIQGNEKHPPK